MNIFVSGSDTGIGKTVVSTVLALKTGYKYWKPIQSGTQDETDTAWVAQRIGPERILKEAYLLRQPLSPHLSARLDGIEINLSSILPIIPPNKTIIEGAGGLLVPLNDSTFMIDLIRKMECPVILVVKSGLGTINHTLLSVEAMKRRGIDQIGIVMVGDKNIENKNAIERYGGISVIGEIPKLSRLDRESLVAAGTFISLEKIKWK